MGFLFSLGLSVRSRILLKKLFPLMGASEIRAGNGPFLGQSVQKNCFTLAVEGVQDPVLNPVDSPAELVETLAQGRGVRPAEGVAALFQESDPIVDVLHDEGVFGALPGQKLQDRTGPVRLLVEKNFDSRRVYHT